MIAGSSWQKDEEYLIESYVKLKSTRPQLKLMCAHEIDKHNIERLKICYQNIKIGFHLYSENLTEYKFRF